jgi:triacylglycerol esterase/lipase EstA (alpha/beta hydrolase family)
MWLRDQLPNDKPTCRVVTYGYDTQLVHSDSFQTIDHLGLGFARQLVTMRLANNVRKPIIQLAHSLGGIVLKAAFLCLASGDDAYTSTLDAIQAVLLFGVPNTGMYSSHLLAMTKSQASEELVRLLSHDSSYLATLDERFNNQALLRRIKVVVAFETKLSSTAVVS